MCCTFYFTRQRLIGCRLYCLELLIVILVLFFGSFDSKASIKTNAFSLELWDNEISIIYWSNGNKTCATFTTDGKAVEFAWSCLDSVGLEAYEVTEGIFLSMNSIQEGLFPMFHSIDYKPVMSFPLLIGLKTPVGDIEFDWFGNPRIYSYGWVRIDYVDGVLEIVDQALAFDESGIVVGSIRTSPTDPPALIIQRTSDEFEDSLEITYQAESTFHYQLQTSSDGKTWTSKGPGVHSRDGKIIHKITPNLDQQFYQLLVE